MSWVSTTPGSASPALMRTSVGLLRGAPGGIRVIKNMTISPWSGSGPGREHMMVRWSALARNVMFGNTLYWCSRVIRSVSAQSRSTPRLGRERARARGNQVLHRLSGLAFVGGERRAFGCAHECALGVNVSVPNLFVAQGAVKARALHTVGLVGLAGVAPDLLWRMDIVDTAQQLGMQRLDVVGLAEAVGDRLPVGLDLDGERGVAAEVAQIAPGDVVGHRLQVLDQRHRVESRLTKTSPSQVSTLAGTSGNSDIRSEPKPLRLGTRLSAPARSQVQPW